MPKGVKIERQLTGEKQQAVKFQEENQGSAGVLEKMILLIIYEHFMIKPLKHRGVTHIGANHVTLQT